MRAARYSVVVLGREIGSFPLTAEGLRAAHALMITTDNADIIRPDNVDLDRWDGLTKADREAIDALDEEASR